MFHVQQEHTGGIGIITAVCPGEDIVYIILRQHDSGDSAEVLRLVLPHPEEFGCGKSRKRNIRRQGRQLFLANLLIQVIHLLCGSAVVPEYRGANDVIILIQYHQTVHLAAAADTGNRCAVKAPQQLGNALHDGHAPILRVLLAPARLWKFQGVLLCHRVLDLPGTIHQQQLCCGCAQVNTDV